MMESVVIATYQRLANTHVTLIRTIEVDSFGHNCQIENGEKVITPKAFILQRAYRTR